MLGSIPFGYIFTKIFTKKNILEIGWKKTSGSNVFYHVGKLPGILTGIFDFLKGSLAIFLARKFGQSLFIQILCGVVAIFGHNWSIFLKFAGGRGVGTFWGGFLVLNPKILGLSLVPMGFLSLIWNASMGTISFLITALILSVHLNQFETVGFYILISLVPIFLKRLSPIEEIKRVEKKAVLIRNRLIFDNDEVCLDLRIKRIIKWLTRKIISDKI